MTAAVLRLKVTLIDVEPKVLRRIEVPADIGLDRLHLTLQAALGWTNSHLFEIRARNIGWVSLLPTGQTDRSTPARRICSTRSKTPGPRRCIISTITATAGSTRSRSNA